MTEKELRKLNRYQLLEVMMMQTERISKLETELQATRAQLEEKLAGVQVLSVLRVLE